MHNGWNRCRVNWETQRRRADRLTAERRRTRAGARDQPRSPSRGHPTSSSANNNKPPPSSQISSTVKRSSQKRCRSLRPIETSDLRVVVRHLPFPRLNPAGLAERPVIPSLRRPSVGSSGLRPVPRRSRTELAGRAHAATRRRLRPRREDGDGGGEGSPLVGRVVGRAVHEPTADDGFGTSGEGRAIAQRRDEPSSTTARIPGGVRLRHRAIRLPTTHATRSARHEGRASPPSRRPGGRCTRPGRGRVRGTSGRNAGRGPGPSSSTSL